LENGSIERAFFFHANPSAGCGLYIWSTEWMGTFHRFLLVRYGGKESSGCQVHVSYRRVWVENIEPGVG
jgi:hypothetical protein